MHNLQLISALDVIWSILLLLILYSWGKGVEAKNTNIPYYSYFSKGLIIKLLGGVLFCLIYALYYKGGDTVHYYEGVNAMNTVFRENPADFIQILFLD